MAILSGLFNSWLNTVRSMANAFGYQIVVETSPHSLHVSFEKPNTMQRAWDPGLFKRGQLYVKGYANPVKPIARQTTSHTEKDEVDMIDTYEGKGNAPVVVGDGGKQMQHTEIISSPRFHSLMQQKIIEAMVRPEQQWKTIVYIMLFIAGVALIDGLMTAFQVFG